MTLSSHRWSIARHGALALAVVASALFALGFGLEYGVSNQATYFIGAVGLLHPGSFLNDWYAGGPGDYHPVFAALGWLLLLPSPDGWGVAIAMAALVTAGTSCVYLLLRELVDDRLALPAFLMLVGLMMLTRTRSAGHSYVFSGGLQPSTVSTVLLLCALIPFVRSQWLRSGLLLGAAGVFHANFLILGLAVFTFAHLLLGWEGLGGRLARQVGPSLAVLTLFLPMILHSTAAPTAEDAARAADVFFNVRAPFHYAPKSFQDEFFPSLAWQVMGLSVGGWALRGSRGRGARLGALLFAMLCAVWAATILTTAVHLPRVAQVYVWRYSPFVDLLCQLLVCATIARVALEPGYLGRIPRQALGGFVAGASALVMLEGNRDRHALSLSLGLLVAVALVLEGARRVGVRLRGEVGSAAVKNKVALGAILAAAVGVIAGRLVDQPLALRLDDGMTSPERAMYAWIREHTRAGVRFISPPELERFRLRSERAIVVDWKGSPVATEDLLEWYARLEAVAGRPGLRTLESAAEGYAAMDNARAGSLAERYAADYLAVTSSSPIDRYAVVYANSTYKILDLHAPSAAQRAGATLGE